VLLRILLLFIVVTLLMRALGTVLRGLMAGASPRDRQASRRAGPPDRGVQMVRDPVCGTFLPPADAVPSTDRRGTVRYFCSEKCRKAYRDVQ
jgi:uncharacterized protein